MQVPLVSRIHAGGGRVAVSLHANKSVLSELSSAYPLKLLSPSNQDATAIVYLLTYGGGLVGGDEVNLRVNVEPGARLILLSQGTTKVFKTRPGRRLASIKVNHYAVASCDDEAPFITKQSLDFHLADNGLLLLLPEPVTCFRDASYNQYQRFHIQDNGSAVILDWITSGRLALGEDWAFSHYHSVNEIFHNGRRIAKDVMVLEESTELSPKILSRSLQERLHPYSCYAMLILFGPQVQFIITEMSYKYDQLSVFKTRSPAPLIWSVTPIDASKAGVIIRVAGMESEAVKEWLRGTLRGLERIVGVDVYRRAFA